MFRNFILKLRSSLHLENAAKEPSTNINDISRNGSEKSLLRPSILKIYKNKRIKVVKMINKDNLTVLNSLKRNDDKDETVIDKVENRTDKHDMTIGKCNFKDETNSKPDEKHFGDVNDNKIGEATDDKTDSGLVSLEQIFSNTNLTIETKQTETDIKDSDINESIFNNIETGAQKSSKTDYKDETDLVQVENRIDKNVTIGKCNFKDETNSKPNQKHFRIVNDNKIREAKDDKMDSGLISLEKSFRNTNLTIKRTHTEYITNSIENDEKFKFEYNTFNMEYSDMNTENLFKGHYSETQNIDEQTTKCLKEFHEVLNEVQSRDDFLTKIDINLSLEDMDDILMEDFDTDCLKCDENKSFEVNNNETDKSPLIDRICQLETDINTVEVKESNGKNVKEHTITLKRADIKNVDIKRDTDTIKHADTKKDTDIIKNVDINKNDDIISISSEDEIDITENLQLKPTLNYNTKTVPKIPDKTKILAQNCITNIKENKTLVDISNSSKAVTKVDVNSIGNKSKSSQGAVKNLDTVSTEGIDTILINSDNAEETDDDCGYHSSDFEFITEDEAKLEGFIVNFDHEKYLKRSATKNKNNIHAVKNKTQNDPYGPGSSKHRSNDDDNYKEAQEMNNCEVPEENELINMFDALPAIPISEIHYLENKSIQTRVPMLVQYEGVGFDMSLALHRKDKSDEKYRGEARESLKKILELYPSENVLKRNCENGLRRSKRKRLI